MHMSGKRDGPFLTGNTVRLTGARGLASGSREVPPQASHPLQAQATPKLAFAARA